MWLLVGAAVSALVRPHNCGNLTQAWSHYFPLDAHNINVECHRIPSTEVPRQTSRGSTIVLWCRIDAECAQMLSTVLFGQYDQSLSGVAALAATIGSPDVACLNSSQCSDQEYLQCAPLQPNTTSYCVPTLPDKDRSWETACFTGAHSTCGELVTNAIGVGAGVLIGLGKLLLAKEIGQG